MLHFDTMWNLFLSYLFIQTKLTLIVKFYKTISINYNLKQNITVLSSIAHDVLDILKADMLNDLKNARFKRPLNSSNHLPNTTENPLDESSRYEWYFFKSNWYYFTTTFLYKTSEWDFHNDTL